MILGQINRCSLPDTYFFPTGNGSTWEKLDHLPFSTVTSLVACDKAIYAGTSVNGVAYSTDNGETWASDNIGLSDTAIQALAVKNNTILVGTQYGGIFLKNNNRTNWTAASIGHQNSYLTYSLCVINNDIYGGTSNGVFHSTDIGLNWTVTDTMHSIYAAAIAVQDSSIYAGTWSSGVFRSQDKGDTWTEVNSITGMLMIPFCMHTCGKTIGKVRAIASLGPNLYVGCENGVVLSTDGGKSWIAMDTTLPSVYSFTTYDTTIFAGTKDGVFKSTINGNKWTEIDSGLTFRRILSLVVNDDMLFAGTDGDGVWRRPLSEIASATEYKLYPTSSKPALILHNANRFNSNIDIEFSIPRGDQVSISIYNLGSKKIASLVNKSFVGGSHSISWNTRDLVTGVYVIRMTTTANNYMKTFSICR